VLADGRRSRSHGYNGAEQVYNLFGLDLIGQDEGSQTRTLLAGGLGSVRMEMVENDVESVTTYGPYGNLLAQTGNDEPIAGTNYGYTGEQHDASTGLLYLRARYYNPSLRSFMGQDPWSGNGGRPQSMNGWSYVEGNPINLIDPTGQTAFRAAYCKTWYSPRNYADCVRNEYGLEPVGSANVDFLFDFHGNPKCWYGPVPYRGRGYLEGDSYTYALFGGAIRGKEVVYDFATMERQNFEYVGIVLQDSIAATASQYVGVIGVGIGRIGSFRSWRNITDDYKGPFVSVSAGIGAGLALGFELGPAVGGGVTGFLSPLDPSIYGVAVYLSGGLAVDPIPTSDLAGTLTRYSPVGPVTNYKMFGPFREPYVGGTYVQYEHIQQDIRKGMRSPWARTIPFSPYGQLETDLAPTYRKVRDLALSRLVSRQVNIFNQIHWHSFEIKE
jgi:RHS repeat-associated protein